MALDDALLSAVAKWTMPGCPHPSLTELRDLAEIEPRVSLRVVSVHRGSDLAALAVCHVEPAVIHGVRVVAYRAFGTKLHDYARLYATSIEAMSYLMKKLREDARDCGADVVHLNNQIAPDFLQAIPSCYLTSTETSLFDASLASNGWQEILERKSVKRDWKKASQQPGYRVETIVGGVCRSDVEKLSAMHQERWEFAGVRSAFINPRRIEEYLCHPANKVLTRVWLGSEIFCCHYGMIYDNLLLFHTPVINIKFLDFSPLKTLMAETARFCAQKELRYLDFGLGDESYKDYSTNANRTIHEIILPVTFKGRVVQLFHRYGHPERVKAGLIGGRNMANRILNAANGRLDKACWHEAGPVTNTGVPLTAELTCLEKYPEFVNFCRQNKLRVLKTHYRRFKAGFFFAALLQDARLLASTWGRREGDFQTRTGSMLPIGNRILLEDIQVGRDPGASGENGSVEKLLRAICHRFPSYSVATVTSHGALGMKAQLSQAGFSTKPLPSGAASASINGATGRSTLES